MHMRHAAVTAFTLLALAFATPVSAQTAASAQIPELIAQIQALQSQLSQMGSVPRNAPSSFACTQFTRDLRRNSKDSTTGGDVSRLQRFLIEDGVSYPEALVTGTFGPSTERAVQRWQVRRNIVSSGKGYGVVGPATRAAMNRACSPATPALSSGAGLRADDILPKNYRTENFPGTVFGSVENVLVSAPDFWRIVSTENHAVYIDSIAPNEPLLAIWFLDKNAARVEYKDELGVAGFRLHSVSMSGIVHVLGQVIGDKQVSVYARTLPGSPEEKVALIEASIPNTKVVMMIAAAITPIQGEKTYFANDAELGYVFDFLYQLEMLGVNRPEQQVLVPQHSPIGY